MFNCHRLVSFPFPFLSLFMSSPKTEYKKTHPKTRKEWRDWLRNNHELEPGVWFVYYRKSTGKPSVSISDAVEEALCFGWIDSVQNVVDHERTMLRFTPRKPKSVWSDINKERVKALIQSKKMAKAGLAAIELAQKNGAWDRLNESNAHSNNNTLPPDLEKALQKNKKAHTNFLAFAHSYRRRFLWWIDSAKREETRKARIKQTVLMSAANKKPVANGFKL